MVLLRCSPPTLRVLLLMKILESDRYGPQKLMTKSRAEFEHITLFTYNGAAIFFGAIPIYGVLPYSIIVLMNNLSVHVCPLVSDSKATRVGVFTNSRVRAYVHASTREHAHVCDMSQTLVHC